MKKLIFGLIILLGISTISYAYETIKLAEIEGLKEISDIKSYQITKADITVLGIYYDQTGCETFKYCYKPMTLTPDKPSNFSLEISGSDEVFSKKRMSYCECDYNLNISFDICLKKPVEKRTYGIADIPAIVTNSTTKVKGKIVKYEFPTNSVYGSYTERTEIPEFVYGPYNSPTDDTKRTGFSILCGGSINYESIPVELKPYAQNIIKIESRYLNDKSLYLNGYCVDEDGNKEKDFLGQTSCFYYIYAVLNSLSFLDGTTITYNSEKIDEKQWMAHENELPNKLPWEGEGTSDSPFLIKNADDLHNLITNYRFIDAGYYFKQEADIDISSFDYWGKAQENLLYYNYQKPFTGHYDGNGKSISGLKIITTDKETNTIPIAPFNDYHGLFHRIRNAEIKNLTINCEIDIGENNKAGALAGEAINATFTNIIVNSNIKGKESIGGLIGEGKNISFSGITVNSNNISGKKFVGGILGKGERILADNLTLKALTVNGEELVGGAFGLLEKNANISNIKADVNVSAKKVCGGVIGCIKEYSSAYNISASGKVTSDSYAGGIFGQIYGNDKKEDKQDLYFGFLSKVDVTSKKEAGGIVGEISENAILSDSINYGTIMGMNIGGIVSFIGASVARCENHGKLKSTEEIKAYRSGGIASRLGMKSTIKDCYNDANLEAKEECGGIVGSNDRGFIENCYAIGEFKTEYYDSKVGGISGAFFSPIGPTSSNLHSTIKNCFITNDTKFSFKGKPSDKKNGTNKCCSEEPTYKESYSNLQRFNSVSDVKLDASWNPEVWEIKAGAYPKLKMASKVSNNSAPNNQPKVETPKEEPKTEVKDSAPAQVETKPAESKPSEAKPSENKPVEEKPVEVKPSETKETQPVEKPVENTKAESASVQTKAETEASPAFDTKEYKPIELKPIKTHPNVVVPEELELEP